MSFNPYNRNPYILHNGVPVDVFLRDPQSNLRARNRRDYDVQNGKWNNPIVHDPRIIGESAPIRARDADIVVGPRPAKRARVSDLDRAVQMFIDGEQRPLYQSESPALLARVQTSALRLGQLTAKEARQFRADMERHAVLLRFPSIASYFAARRLVLDAPDAPYLAVLQNQVTPELYEFAILQERSYNDNITAQVASFVPPAQRFSRVLDELDEPNLGVASEEDFVTYKTEQLDNYDTLSNLLEAYVQVPEDTSDQEVFDTFIEKNIGGSTLDFDVEQRNLFAAVSRFPSAAAQLRLLEYVEAGQPEAEEPPRKDISKDVMVEIMDLREDGDEKPIQGYTLVKGFGDGVKSYAEDIYKFYDLVIKTQDKIGVVGKDLGGKLRDPRALAIQKRTSGPVLLKELNEAEEKWYKEPERRIVAEANGRMPGSNYQTLQDVLKSVDAFEEIRASSPPEERGFGSGYAVWAREWATIRKAVALYGDGTAQKGVLEDGRDTIAYTKQVLEKASQGLEDIGKALPDASEGSEVRSGGSKRRTRK